MLQLCELITAWKRDKRISKARRKNLNDPVIKIVYRRKILWNQIRWKLRQTGREKPPYQFIIARLCRSNRLRSITTNRKTSDIFSLHNPARNPDAALAFAIRARYNPKIDARSRRAAARISVDRGGPVGCLVTVAQYRLAYLWNSKNLNKFPAASDERLVSTYPKGWLFIHLIRAAAAPPPATLLSGVSLEPRPPSFDFRQSFTALLRCIARTTTVHEARQ
jgi:hypothetical protein